MQHAAALHGTSIPRFLGRPYWRDDIVRRACENPSIEGSWQRERDEPKSKLGRTARCKPFRPYNVRRHAVGLRRRLNLLVGTILKSQLIALITALLGFVPCYAADSSRAPSVTVGRTSIALAVPDGYVSTTEIPRLKTLA